MKLEVVSPRSYAEHLIAWIELHTATSSLVIYRGHAPMILVLGTHQAITFKLKTGKQQSLRIAGGIAHIGREEVQLLITHMEE
jgi:F0F1-type ATP synthase epsilon subunit